MKSCSTPLFLTVLIVIVLYSLPILAEGVYYTPEGLEIKKYSIPKPPKQEKKVPVTKKKQSDKTTVVNKRKASEPKVVLKKKKYYSDPEEAASAGYKPGQTVMIKKGIIYKLAKDSKTGKFIYRRYRKIKKKSATITATPAEAAEAGYKVGQTVMVRKGIIYKLARDLKTGKYKYKRYRKVKHKSKPKQTNINQTEVSKPVLSKPETKKMEPADNVEREPRKTGTNKIKIIQTKPMIKSVNEKTEIKVNKSTEEKVETKGVVVEKKEPGIWAEEKKLKQKNETQKPAISSNNSSKMYGRNMGRFKMAVSYRHSFLDRKTVANDRKLTQGGLTRVETTDVGAEDIFFTDMHNDSIRFRLGLTNSIEAYIDAGFAYDKISNVADMEPVFGLGVRYNIKSVESGLFSGTYLAFSSEFMQGKLSTEYSASDGSVYSQENDWQDITATFETGIVLSKMTFYSGISYMLYSESMSTKEIQPTPGDNILEEELEQQSSLNISGGIEYHYSPKLNLQLEIQTPNRQGAIISVEYRF